MVKNLSMSAKRYFEFVEGPSNKFWEIRREGSEVKTRYGRIGTAGQTTVKNAGDETEAQKLHDTLVGEKTEKGYLEKGAQKVGAKKAPQAAAPARSKSLADALKALVAELKGNKQLTVKAKFRGPASAKVLAQASAKGLGDGFLSLWKEMNGLDVEWAEKENDDVRGGIGLLPLEEMLREDREGRIFFDSDPPDDPKRKFYPIEGFDPYGNGHTSGVLLDGKTEPQIYYLSGEPELLPLKISLGQFIALMGKTRGVLYWTQAFLDWRAKEGSETLDDMEENFPRLFGEKKLAAVFKV